MKSPICKICGNKIDKSYIRKSFSIITIPLYIEDETDIEHKKERFYLCDSCTAKLKIFILDNTRLHIKSF